jgi:protoheme IX farnesyltransferase
MQAEIDLVARSDERSSEPSVAPASTSQVSSVAFVRDLIALTKPKITRMVAATMVGGMWLAARTTTGGATGRALPSMTHLGLGLLGTVLVVAGANALNMYLERDTDALMTRTANRPLPARRMRPEVALIVGLCLSAIAVPVLSFGVNALTGLFAGIALASYVLVYTPLKRRTTAALLIGAVPGAVPPLLGWTTVTGHLDLPGALLFGVLFFWQIPHFIAISTFRREEYARAGLKVLPVERGDAVARVHAVLYSIALVAVSLGLVAAHVGGAIYFASASVLGAGFLGIALYGLRPSAGDRWAKTLFFYSLVYLVLLLASLFASV